MRNLIVTVGVVVACASVCLSIAGCGRASVTFALGAENATLDETTVLGDEGGPKVAMMTFGCSASTFAEAARMSASPCVRTKPSSASRIAGAMTLSRGSVPYFCSSVSSPITVPGTATAK